MIHHAQRIIANAITHALRGPWHLDGFDARGNRTGPTSPFRLTARAPTKPPSVFVERFVWGITDPDYALGVPALAWLLTQHAHLLALSRHPHAHQTEYRTMLNDSSALPFRRARNRHGTAKYRRAEHVTPEAALVALAIASAARVTLIPSAEYRYAFPIDLAPGRRTDTLQHA